MKRPFLLKLRLYGKVFLALFILFICWYIYVFNTITEVEQTASPRKADVAIVLGAAVWDDKPSPGLRERLDLALQLYKDKYVLQLLVSGGLGEGKIITEAAAMKNYLVEQGVPEKDILMEGKSTDTYENLQFSKQIMQEHSLKTALVISHSYHLARALEIATSLDMDVAPVGVTTSVMYLPYYKSKEVLAYTKWKLTQIFI